MYTIYGITFHKVGHRYDGRLRYIGLTKQSLLRRLSQHASRRGNGALWRAIAKHGVACFQISPIEVASTLGEARQREVALIEARRTRVTDRSGGLNVSRGGDAVDYSNAAIRAKHRAGVARRDAMADKASQSAEYSTRMKKTRAGADFMQRQRAALAAAQADPIVRARLGEVGRVNLAAAHAANQADPEKRRARIRSAWADPDAKANQSARIKQSWIARRAKFGPSGSR